MSTPTKKDRKLEELERIKAASKDGLLTPHDVVAFVLKNRDSALAQDYGKFDVKKAAYKHWLEIARRQIRVHIEILPQTTITMRRFVSPVDVRNRGGGYLNMSEVLTSEQHSRNMVLEALSHLKMVRAKYLHLQQLTGVFLEIERLSSDYGVPVKAENRQPVAS